MKDRFQPHPKNPSILVGNTYKIPNYKKPWDVDKAMREEMAKQVEAKAEIINLEMAEV